ncbi:hypothetical protein ACIHAR_02185 [Streptomyces sp. NPDC052016]|uniref:hypothetical protein n=1 Tax=Streptomyces sp. NPDC052016 TaxID=3365680 RepID=UPI0037D7E952
MSRSDLLGTIMREHRDSLVSCAEKMLGDHGLAEDIVQETPPDRWPPALGCGFGFSAMARAFRHM